MRHSSGIKYSTLFFVGMVAFSVVISFLNPPKKESQVAEDQQLRTVITGSIKDDGHIKQLLRPSIPINAPSYMKIPKKEAQKIDSDAQHIINELKTLVEDLKQAQSGPPPHKID